MQPTIYELPEVTFVGGDHQILRFTLYTRSGELYDTGADRAHPFCTAKFSILGYSNKPESAVLRKDTTFEKKDGVYCVLRIDLLGTDTIDLHGRYIYQIELMDIMGRVDVPRHGLLNIADNIDGATFKDWWEKGIDSDLVTQTKNVKSFRQGKSVIATVSSRKKLAATFKWYDASSQSEKHYMCGFLENGTAAGKIIHILKLYNVRKTTHSMDILFASTRYGSTTLGNLKKELESMGYHYQACEEIFSFNYGAFSGKTEFLDITELTFPAGKDLTGTLWAQAQQGDIKNGLAMAFTDMCKGCEAWDSIF